jgi:hypothetical protein
LSPFLTSEAHFVDEDTGVGGKVLIILTSELDGGEWSVSGPGSFTSGESLQYLLVARVPDYRFRGPGSIPGTTRFSEK